MWSLLVLQVQKQVASVHNEPFSTWLGSKRKYRACTSAKINWKSHRSLIKNPLRLISCTKKHSCECFRRRKGWLNNSAFTASCLHAVQYSWRKVPVLPPLATVTCFPAPENSGVSFHASHAGKSPFLHYPWYTWFNPPILHNRCPNFSFVWREIRDL